MNGNEKKNAELILYEEDIGISALVGICTHNKMKENKKMGTHEHVLTASVN